MNGPSGTRKLRCGTCREVSDMEDQHHVGRWQLFVWIPYSINIHIVSNWAAWNVLECIGNRVCRSSTTNREKSRLNPLWLCVATPSIPRPLTRFRSMWTGLARSFVCDLVPPYYFFFPSENTFLLNSLRLSPFNIYATFERMYHWLLKYFYRFCPRWLFLLLLL